MNQYLNHVLLLFLAMLYIFGHSSAFPFIGDGDGDGDDHDHGCDSYCMQGICEGNFFPVKCACHSSWSNLLNLPFLPCIIPNCSFAWSCDKSEESNLPMNFDLPENISFLNPCNYPVCGKGDCIAKDDGTLSYICKCHKGHENLLGSPSGFCMSGCNVGADCKNVGISVGGTHENMTGYPSPNYPETNGGSPNKGKSSTITVNASTGQRLRALELALIAHFIGLCLMVSM